MAGAAPEAVPTGALAGALLQLFEVAVRAQSRETASFGINITLDGFSEASAVAGAVIHHGVMVDDQLYNRPGDIWWNEQEPLSMLRTMLNPARFGFFRAVLTDDGRIDPRGRTALDVGCGGGLLAEECARLGLLVTGIDPSARSVRTAREHARQSHLAITYLAGAGEMLPFADASYDVVFCCDVLEHLENPAAAIAEISRVLKPAGYFLYDTINRTLRSKFAVIGLFQQWRWTSCVPPDLHDWSKFIKPRELREMMAQYGLESRRVVGMKPQVNPIDLIRQLRKRKRSQISYGELGRRIKMRAAADLSTSYMGWAVKAAHPPPSGTVKSCGKTG